MVLTKRSAASGDENMEKTVASMDSVTVKMENTVSDITVARPMLLLSNYTLFFSGGL